MKTRAIILFIVSLVTVSCNPGDEIRLQVFNPLDQQRNDATILLSRGAIAKWTDIPMDLLPILKNEDGVHIPCQVDDLNGDGEWNELFALTDMGPSSQMTLLLTFISSEKFPSFDARTNLRLGANQPGYPELQNAKRLEGVAYHNYSGRTGAAFQMEGPAWESDMVGFRNYMDQRNGMDIFGKLTRAMVLDSVGVAGRQSYHDPDEWGMDVLKVGTSLGAGAIGYMLNDSIYRVGDNGSGSYDVQFEGSQRSRFNLSYQNWRVGETTLDVVHQIEIVAGRHCYQSSVTYSGTDMNLALVPGIVNMKSDTMYVLNLNDHFTGLMTHDYQAEDTTLLAMALVVPTGYLKEYGETKERGDGITQTYFVMLDAQPDQPVPYRFYALWEKEDPRWASLEMVTEFLKIEADRWAQSVIIERLP
ncbi:MAG: DUF4861 family protein [Bacteroidales bacterium]|nr:DUF4861 family protein [Bacteroidales bacterium]